MPRNGLASRASGPLTHRVSGVRRPEKRHDVDFTSLDSWEDEALDPRTATGPYTVTLGDPNVSAGNISEPSWASWREEVAAIGGPSPLLHFVDAPRTRIELSSTHPGGLPQFITGDRTLLSSLIRDDIALRTAKAAAGAITAKGIELRAVRGIDAIHLGVGLAHWRDGAEEYDAPVLLRPVAIRRYGRDFELKLRGRTFLNPELKHALHQQFRIELDADAFVALSESNGVFKPQPVIDRLRGLTSHLEFFSVQPRLVVSSFADVASSMSADLGNFDHDVLLALSGNPSARERIEGAFSPAEVVPQDNRPPSIDTLLVDADPEQEGVVAQVASGNSIVVKTLPGTGATQTVVNAIGALVARNRRVLVVGPRRSSLDAIAHRLDQVGLGGAAVATRSVRRDLIRSITRNEKAAKPATDDVDDALVRLRRVLLDYRGALTSADPAFGVSVLDALGELARLALLPTPPRTRARLDRASIEALARDRTEAAGILRKAAALGEFRYGPGDSPWYGADFASTSQATAAHALAKKLSSIEVPRLIDRATTLIEGTRLRPFENITELGVYLRLLADLRETLDRFLPAVFDRPLDELITATSNRRDTPGMSGATRRRLRKLALEYVRPGGHVADLNESLRRIQQQRKLWNRFADAGAPPRVPVGVADVQVAYQRVSEDLTSLDVPLGRTGTAQSLMTLPLNELTSALGGLAVESEVLINLQERTSLLSRLRELHLDPLLSDLSARHVTSENVAAELELAWWQSVLETLLADDTALLGANTRVLDRLEADFRLVDQAHASATGQMLASQLSVQWKIALADNLEQADALRRMLKAGNVTPALLAERAPQLSRVLAPVWLASPYDVASLPASMAFDTVVLVDAGACTLVENIGAIRRARQVVAFGDPVTQTPSPFRIAVTDPSPAAPEPHDVDAWHDSSALARLSDLLPVYTLTRSYRSVGDDLAELVNRRFYGGQIESLPWAGSFLGHASLTLSYVRGGHGMPDGDTGTVESVDAELARVVELVLEHALNRSRESLMVVTASAKHAVRVQHAVLAASTKRQELADFILGDRPEPFTVVTLEESVAQSRDRVIFSIGYGRTPHGRLLSSFGPLGEPGGERLLAVGLTRARRAMDIVSCFRPDDIDVSRMKHGIVALAQVLEEAAEIEAADDAVPDDSEPLLIDLAYRLEKLGMNVQLGHRGVLPLAASFRGKAVVVETDRVLGGASLRESLRLRPEVLRRLGWHYLRVHSFELFADPEAVAQRIGRLLGAIERDDA
ncbi:AAA family ATPase [Humibacter albus]|uniref:AAA family ATPase n=1 Tax=Humibacter albus TaxID=427754 RepID=UPI001FE1CC66|nr:AAA family ATPase [Humibacter albus]